MPDPTHTTHDTRQLLLDLIEQQGLNRQAVADLTRSSEHAVRSWLREPGTGGARRIPPGLIELAYLRLGLASPFDGRRLNSRPPLRKARS